MKNGLVVLIVFISFQIQAQIQSKNLHLKTFMVKNDSVQIDTVSISSANFKVFNLTGTEIDTSKYNINFSSSLLIFKSENKEKFEEVNIQYTSFPNFLTKNYFALDKKFIVPNSTNKSQLYSLTSNQKKTQFQPFDGLDASGTLTRGVTVGNNQNAVSNSMLDLQIAGKLSDKVTLKASIVDTNLPIQENGNTYKLNEFDRVFIELYTDDWSINAGDIYLNNNETEFLRFNKKIAGLAVDARIRNNASEIDAKVSGGFVKGKYNKLQFNGIEGNQGPYRITDFANNNYVLVLSGTEQIYVNGILLKRGEENDYVIDYNNGEVTFNTTFPITGNMRISAEYQYTDRVYNRFITYDKVNYKQDKFTVGSYFYSESDLKNQSLEPELTNEQEQILANAGNDKLKMISPSAFETEYSENAILYIKTMQGTTEIFEYSTDETAELYQVTFSYVGTNIGAYVVKENIATGTIYEYVGENLGNYAPVIELIAPTKLQVVVFTGGYNPSSKTNINAEAAFSNNNQNLFSEIGNENNKGMASKAAWDQVIFEKNWKLKSSVKYDFISKDFKTVQRIENIEFDRDWNIVRTYGNQQLIRAGLNLTNQKNSSFQYSFSNLKFGDDYIGYNNYLAGNYTKNKLTLNFDSSLLNNSSTLEDGNFLRYYINGKYLIKNGWFGTNLSGENNQLTNNNTSKLDQLSHKFNEYEAFVAYGDSTKIFTQVGAILRTTDSVQNFEFQKVSNSKTYYLKSNFVNSKSTQLNVYVNYRNVENVNIANESSLNSKIIFKQQIWHQFVTLNTVYETRSGTMALQDYTYTETEPGQGFYMWVDYNENGIKELNEFEIAQFADQARYLRVLLPTINYVPTYQNIFSQSIIINPQQWASQKGIKNVLSHFYNQTSMLIDGKQQKEDNSLNLNPFDINNKNILGLIYNFNNSFYFNKGKKDFSTTYRYSKSQNKNTTSYDDYENIIQLHQLQFEHEISTFWLFNFDVGKGKNQSISASYANRNYNINGYALLPKMSYVLNKDAFFAIYYSFKNKENTEADFETLATNEIGFSANYALKERSQLKAAINIFNNKFTGNSFTPVAYQMLEGLQPGKNYTWSLLFQRRLFSFLNLNINYLGRKSETSKTIHTGSVELKAHF
jgi:hypothetical protein